MKQSASCNKLFHPQQLRIVACGYSSLSSRGLQGCSSLSSRGLQGNRNIPPEILPLTNHIVFRLKAILFKIWHKNLTCMECGRERYTQDSTRLAWSFESQDQRGFSIYNKHRKIYEIVTYLRTCCLILFRSWFLFRWGLHVWVARWLETKLSTRCLKFW